VHVELLFDGGKPPRVGAEKRTVGDGVGGALDIGSGQWRSLLYTGSGENPAGEPAGKIGQP
jgi:hypothetical protein